MIIAKEGTRLWIGDPEPQIWIDYRVLAHLNHPDVDFANGGTVLTINAVNRRVVYRIDYSRTHPHNPALIHAEWPD